MIRVLIVLLAGLCLAAPAVAAPLTAYGDLPSVSDIEVSPDGGQIAMLVGQGTDRQIQVRGFADLKPRFVSPIADVKIREILWAGDNHLLIVTSAAENVFGLLGPKREYFMLTDLDLIKKQYNALLGNMWGRRAAGAMNVIVGLPSVRQIDGHIWVLAEGISFLDRRGVVTLYKINLETGFTTTVQTGDDETRSFLVGPLGRPIAESRYNPQTGRWSLLTNGARGWRSRYTVTAMIDTPNLEGLGRSEDSILIGLLEKGQWVHREVPLDGDALSAPIEGLTDDLVIRDPKTRVMIGSAHDGLDRTVYNFLKPEDQANWSAVSRAFPNEQVTLTSWSQDRSKIVAHVEGPQDGVGFYTIDMATRHAAWLADEYAGVGPTDVSATRVVDYVAADGLPLKAYLTLPKGSPAKGLPAVVLVHGGPAARDDPGFDWWTQALASRGYAVIQPQYRGSDGFGEALLTAGYGEWGRKMQTDVSDAVRAVVKSGEIDRERVCIVGASYGGYAALAGAAFDPGVYRCAVSVAGPADLRNMLAYEYEKANYEQNVALRYWDRFMGAKSAHDPALDAISPARHADKISIPVLLIHGADDTVVDYDQSREMSAALRRAGRPAELITLKGEDHWLSRSATRIQMLTATAAFLEAQNPSGLNATSGVKTASVLSQPSTP